MMKIKRKLTSLILMVAVVIALLPAVGAKDIQAIIWSHPIVREDGSIKLLIAPYAGRSVEDAGFAGNVTKNFFENESGSSKQTISLKETWSKDDNTVMSDSETFEAGKKYTYKAFLRSENVPGRPAVELSKDKFTIVDYATGNPFEWESEPDVSVRNPDMSLYTLEYTAVFTVMTPQYDLGSLTIDLSKGAVELSDSDYVMGIDNHLYAAVSQDKKINYIDVLVDHSNVFEATLDLDKDGKADVDYLVDYSSNIVRLEKLSTNSIKEKTSIDLSLGAKIWMDTWWLEKYYSTLTFVFKRSVSVTTLSGLTDQSYTGFESNRI